MIKFVKRAFRYIKSKFNLTAVLSMLAILVSIVTMYYQFFNTKHELLYAFMFPSVEEKLIIPIVYKNNGNQNELILESNVELEIIPDDGSEKYFKRIGDENKTQFPLIISPGDYKVINLLGDYNEYFKGMMEYSPTGLKYREIVNLDTLSIVITTKFVSGDGIAQSRRNLGKITFRKDRSYERIDINPINLIELEADEDIVMTAGSVVNAGYNMQFNFSDSLRNDQIEQIKFMINVIEDTTIRKALIKVLKKNKIDYPK